MQKCFSFEKERQNGENVVSSERNNKMQKLQKSIQKTKQKNYVQSLEAIKSLSEPKVRKSSLPQPESAYRSLLGVAGRRIPK